MKKLFYLIVLVVPPIIYSYFVLLQTHPEATKTTTFIAGMGIIASTGIYLCIREIKKLKVKH